MLKREKFIVMTVVIVVVVIGLAGWMYRQSFLQTSEGCAELASAFQKSLQTIISVDGLGGSLRHTFVSSCISSKYRTCIAIYDRTAQYDTPGKEYSAITLDLRTQKELRSVHKNNYYESERPIQVERLRHEAIADACVESFQGE